MYEYKKAKALASVVLNAKNLAFNIPNIKKNYLH